MPGFSVRPGSLATRLVHTVESLIIVVLLVLLGIVLAVATGQLVITVVSDTIRTWNTVHSIDELTELRPVFSGFLLILIGLEGSIKTIAMYLADNIVQVEVVLTVAMIAAGSPRHRDRLRKCRHWRAGGDRRSRIGVDGRLLPVSPIRAPTRGIGRVVCPMVRPSRYVPTPTGRDSPPLLQDTVLIRR